jgi:hypothetical protein
LAAVREVKNGCVVVSKTAEECKRTLQ